MKMAVELQSLGSFIFQHFIMFYLIVVKLMIGAAFRKGERGYTGSVGPCEKSRAESPIPFATSKHPRSRRSARWRRRGRRRRSWTTPSARSSSASRRATRAASSARRSSASPGAASSPTVDFLRRYRAFHRTPPVLGFFYSHYRGQRLVSSFVPTARAPPIPQPPPAAGSPTPTCCVLDCRHGRLLLHDTQTSDHTVWDPTTGDQQRFSFPGNPPFHDFTAAVLCTEDGCDHLGCSGGPFLVVFVGTDSGSDDEGYEEGENDIAWASVYSSETDFWSASTSIDGISFVIEFMPRWPSLLAGGALCFILGLGEDFLKYDLATGALSVVSSPLEYLNFTLVTAEDDGLGVVTVDDYSLHLWSWRIDSHGVGQWMRGRVIGLDATASIALGDPSAKLDAVGFAEGADSVFISASGGIFTVELKSGRVRKIGEGGDFDPVFPFMSFCTPDHGSTRLLAPTGME
ncbi:hypothetical protein U9M48_011515 [Paspalum notatum var. saurae]|uniref:F-box protein AT5G49610-like beta-propeller domain-containing protein n=1 Tax=Paspalum notatum var. saurae TaxID=547442 RepID=A0AAQ3SVY9_PASNO